jgi:hypothetical protein
MDDVEDVEELPNAMREQLQWVFKDALRKHLSYAYSNGQIQWPKIFTKFQKKSMPILEVIITLSLVTINLLHLFVLVHWFVLVYWFVLVHGF